MLLLNNMNNAVISVRATLPIGWLCIVLLMLTGCNTPQQKAQNSPPPLAPPPQQTSQSESPSNANGTPEQTQAQTQASEAQTGTDSTQNDSSQSAEQANSGKSSEACAPAPAPPTMAPDVEITDVPLDANGNPIEPDVQTIIAKAPSPDECKTAENSQDEQRQAASQANQAQASDPQQQQQSAGLKAGGAQTSEEKLAAANANMDARLAAFDELMRRAREAAEQQRAAANGNPAGQNGGGYGGEYAGQGENQRMPDPRGEGGQADTSSGLGHTPDRSGETRPGDHTQVARGPVPANMPDGRDDDIVARQLREAASKETDPVLREKLWQEYKKYKTGVVGR